MTAVPTDAAAPPAFATGLYDRLARALADGVPAATATVVGGEPLGAKLLVLPDGDVGTLGDGTLDARAAGDARDILGAARPASVTRRYPRSGTAGVEVFLEVFPAPPTLLIVGAVHVAQALARFAKQLGFYVIVADARAKLATAERFPDADRIVVAWPDDALAQVAVGPSTHVAILTHDPKFDEPALLGALATPAAYIGAVGSRGTNRDRRHRLLAAGLAPEGLARVRGPIGLDIGAETPEEMAISILAEIIAVRHGRAGGSLTDADGPIRGARPGDEAGADAAPPA